MNSSPNTRRLEMALPILLALLLGACTTIGPTLTERTPEELGPYPENYRTIARHWIEDSIRGVTSVETLTVTKPKPGFADSLLTRRRYGWWTHLAFRARDRMGLSKGKMYYSLLLRDGKVVARQKQLD